MKGIDWIVNNLFDILLSDVRVHVPKHSLKLIFY